MALDFPTSPTVGQTYSYVGRTWQYNGTGWQSLTGLGPGVKVQIFNASGTYTPSPGMRYAIIECVGPGGGGGGVAGAVTHSLAAAGGGAGAYSCSFVTAAQVGASQAVTVGTGGTGGTAGANTGGNGSSNTSVGSLCSAEWAIGGSPASTGIAPARGPGGTLASAIGDIKLLGGDGGGFWASITTTRGPSFSGGSYFGGGSVTGMASAGAGQNGNLATAPGTGGCGGVAQAVASNFAGANGANGIAIITEFIGSSYGQAINSIPGTLFGCGLANNGTTSLDVAAGFASADVSPYNLMNLGTLITKVPGTAWAVGSGNGSLDTGAVAATTWYHVWVIQRPDTGVVDVLTSTSATAPTMPANYTLKRRIGSIYVVSTGPVVVRPFIQDGDRFQWQTPINDVSAVTTTTATTRTLSTPLGLRVLALLSVACITTNGITSNTGYTLISDLSCADVAPTAAAFSIAEFDTFANVGVVGAPVECYTNTSSQVRSRSSLANAVATFSVNTHGWVDTRGRV